MQRFALLGARKSSGRPASSATQFISDENTKKPGAARPKLRDEFEDFWRSFGDVSTPLEIKLTMP
jgi:hypothetical protein